MRDLESILSQHPFLQGLSREHLKLITGCAKNVRFNAGEFVFRHGEEADSFYIIRHGRMALEIYSPERGPIEVHTVSEGEVVGWSWLIPPYKWHFDARAKELTRAIVLDGKCLRKKCEADHDLGFELFKRFSHIMSETLHDTMIQLMDVYGK